MKKLLLLSLLSLCSIANSAVIEFPQPNIIVNGIHSITGSICSWESLKLDNDVLSLNMEDTITDQPGSCNNYVETKFTYLINFSDLSIGEHKLSWCDLEEGCSQKFYVVVNNVSVTDPQVIKISNFPQIAVTSTLLWNNKIQAFIIQSIDPFIQIISYPMKGEYGTLKGKVNVNPNDYKIIALSRSDAWYTKPWYIQPDTLINSDGSFEVDVHTGDGNPILATEIALFLVKIDYATPIVKGFRNIPQEIIDNAIYKLHLNR